MVDRVPMFIPGTIDNRGEVMKGPFVPDNVPIKVAPLPNTTKHPGGFTQLKTTESVKRVTSPPIVEAAPEEDMELAAIRKRHEG